MARLFCSIIRVMCVVYFGDKIINFTSAVPSGCDAVWTPFEGERITVAKMLEKLGNTKSLCVKTESPRLAFEDFLREFEQVDAAGGIVQDSRSRILMILRNGRWDLPKGHMEPGENPRQAALREVEEETGVRAGIENESPVETYHFYPFGERWRMKRTYWYKLRLAQAAASLTPQTEEGIEAAEWVPVPQVQEYAQGSFAAVKHVIENYLKTK